MRTPNRELIVTKICKKNRSTNNKNLTTELI